MGDETPHRIVLDLETGESKVEPLEGDELAEWEARQNEPPPEPEPTPVEELNEGIQAAASLADVKAVFADWSEKHRHSI